MSQNSLISEEMLSEEELFLRDFLNVDNVHNLLDATENKDLAVLVDFFMRNSKEYNIMRKVISNQDDKDYLSLVSNVDVEVLTELNTPYNKVLMETYDSCHATMKEEFSKLEELISLSIDTGGVKSDDLYKVDLVFQNKKVLTIDFNKRKLGLLRCIASNDPDFQPLHNYVNHNIYGVIKSDRNPIINIDSELELNHTIPFALYQFQKIYLE